jgi:hypothetical protein
MRPGTTFVVLALLVLLFAAAAVLAWQLLGA